MKKRWILCVSCIVLFLMTGCRGDGIHEIRPDDEVSKSVKDSVGGQFKYYGHEEYKDIAVYYFEIECFETQAISNFVEGCNNFISADKKNCFHVTFFRTGGNFAMFTVRNYNDDDVIYDSICYLRIVNQVNIYEKACNPELYSGIEGIRELHVDKAIQDKADDMGIDWYDYWPELEKFVIEEK